MHVNWFDWWNLVGSSSVPLHAPPCPSMPLHAPPPSLPPFAIPHHRLFLSVRMSSAQPSQNQDRLRSHFNGYDASAHPQRWDSLWSDGTFLPWDRGHANPALIDTLNQPNSSLLPPSHRKPPHGRPARALVPGCGKGYDLALFAAHGYDAYGVEVSEHAVKAAQDYLADPGEGPLEGEYRFSHPTTVTGTTKCVLGDFFDDAWLAQIDGGLGEGFDIIYDNTVGTLEFLAAQSPDVDSIQLS